MALQVFSGSASIFLELMICGMHHAAAGDEPAMAKEPLPESRSKTDTALG
jgi:hypothetical protein